VVAGNPARIVRSLADANESREELMSAAGVETEAAAK
jgi:hypothetical protein